MLPRSGGSQVNAATAAATRTISKGGSYRRMPASATTMAATATSGVHDATLAATISVKDVQRCFEKERRAFLRDLESLRQQLVKKDQIHSKAAATASQHAIQLKKEIASLQSALVASEKQRTTYEHQFRHTSALLETAMDQHQADHAKLTELSETIRTIEKKHDDALSVVRKEAAANVNNTHEERKALRARVDQLRCKLESERKEWQTLRKPMSDDLEKRTVRLQIVEKELSESRFREQSSFQLKDKMQSEVVQYKRKVTDLTTALQDTLHAKSEMKAEHQLMVRKMKDKWRDILHQHQQAHEQLVMLQEDYNGLFRSRQSVLDANDRICQSMRTLKSRHEIVLKEKDAEFWELEKRFKRNSATCTVCMKTPEQRQEELQLKMETVREQTQREVAKEMELERWDRFQDVNAKYMDACRQLQLAMRDGDAQQKELKTQLDKHEELQLKEKKLVDLLSRAEKRVQELERKTSEDAQRSEETKHQLQELLENLTKMTTLTADQSKQLQELELGRREEMDRAKENLKSLEDEKQQLMREKFELRQQLDQQCDAYDTLKDEKIKQWNEIMTAQLSANLLIEEQAHTIDNLLKTSRFVSPSKTKCSDRGAGAGGSSLSSSSCSPQRKNDHQTSGASFDSLSSSAVGTMNGNDSATVMVLRRECEHLRDELSAIQSASLKDKEALQSEYEKKVVELMREVTHLQRERGKLKRRLEDQAVTIHELTLQDDDDDDEEEEEEEEEELREEEEEEEEPFMDQRNVYDLSYERKVAPLPRHSTSRRPLDKAPRRQQQPRQHHTNSKSNGYSSSRQTPPKAAQHSQHESRIRNGRTSVTFKNMSQELSAIQPDCSDDEDTTIGISFLSAN